MHQSKSLLNGKMGICLLTANQMCVSKKRRSAEVVTICMLLRQSGYVHHEVWQQTCGFESHVRRKADWRNW